jgi:hypothetical protein
VVPCLLQQYYSSAGTGILKHYMWSSGSGARRSIISTIRPRSRIQTYSSSRWMVHRTLPLRTDLVRVDEFICENNRNYSGLFKK